MQKAEKAAAACEDYDAAEAHLQQHRAMEKQADTIQETLNPPDELVLRLTSFGFHPEQVKDAYRELDYESDEDQILVVLAKGSAIKAQNVEDSAPGGEIPFLAAAVSMEDDRHVTREISPTCSPLFSIRTQRNHHSS